MSDIKQAYNIRLRKNFSSTLIHERDELDEKVYFAIVADIKDSRYGDESRWGDLTALLEKARVLLNKVFVNSFEKEVVFSGGDSIQGVFKDIWSAYLYSRLLLKIFYPEKIRIGIGAGDVFSLFNDKNSNYSTGQAFINAQDALDRAKWGNYDIQIKSSKQDVDDINILLELLTYLRNDQTDYQKEMDLITEILFPIVNSKMNNPTDQLVEIVEFKNTLSSFRIDNAEKQEDTKINLFLNNLNEDRYNYSKPIYIFSGSNEHLLSFAEKANIYGIQSDIALLTQTTKQNVSKMFKKANIENIRKYDLVIIKKMGDLFNDHYSI
ncbi:MAG: hypothetical protein C4537_05330 [Acholeplasma sp.]|jgi:hypothetical protein|nr:MAG: hypothetical protein C4537_05330 [Acholeplasma sp.]